MKITFTTVLLLMILSVGFSASAQWTTLNSGTFDPLQQVFFPNDTVGYALGADYNVFKTSDGGQSWTNPSTLPYGTSLYFISGDTGFASDGSDDTGMYGTTDGGTTWDSVSSTMGLFDAIMSFSFPGNGNIGFAGGVNYSYDSLIIYKTTDRGTTWKRFNTEQFYIATVDIFFTDTNTGYWADTYGGIFKSNDGGVSWNNQYTDTSVSMRHSIFSICFPAQDTGYAVGDSGTILKTTDGVNWAYLPQSVTYDLLTTVWFTSTQKGFAADQSGNIIETTDGGQNWTLNLNAGVNISSIYFSSPNTGYACGGNGEILKYGVTTGLKQLEDENKFLIYPNPVSNLITINTSFSIGNEAVIKITNLLGEVLKVENGNFGNEQSLNIKDIPSGIYFISVTTEKDKWIGKFVKE